jgi:hypothetical protein
MRKPMPKRLMLAKETLRDLENAGLRRAGGGAPTQIQTDCTCTSDNSFCTN